MAERSVRDKSRRARARARSESTDLAALFKMAEEGEPGLLGSRAFRIRQLLTSENHQVRVQTERLLMEQQFGKPYQAGEITTNETVRYLIEAPAEETASQWLVRHAKAREDAASVQEREVN